MNSEAEPITPAQTTFLKLLDAYLQSKKRVPNPTTYIFLTTVFRDLLLYCQTSIRVSLNARVEAGRSIISEEQHKDATSVPTTDARLPKACEALVLICQCLITLLLQEETGPASLKPQLLSGAADTLELHIDVLRLLDALLPRVSLHAAANADLRGFSYIKRDLVRVLGTLAHEDPTVQERARLAGGIHVVLNLCVEDARNPYLREHAIFALRNLLRDNAENQKILNDMKLMGVEDAEGILRDVRRGPLS